MAEAYEAGNVCERFRFLYYEEIVFSLAAAMLTSA